VKTIGIIYGSDTGTTEDVTLVLKDLLRDFYVEEIEVIEVCNAEESDFTRFDLLLIGLSTWYDGDLQSDWEDYFETLKTIDFTNQIVAIYGLGDQYAYAEYFIDGVGIIAKEIIKNGGNIIGEWSTEGYDFESSKALKNPKTFYGLAIDDDNEQELTESRIIGWIQKIKFELPEIAAS